VCVGSGGERLLPEWYSEKGTIQKFSCSVKSHLNAFVVTVGVVSFILRCPSELSCCLLGSPLRSMLDGTSNFPT
jgi:hypothetical protein